MLGLALTEQRGRPPDPAAAALIARMSVAPDAARVSLIDAAVRALKAAGVWDRLDCCWVMAAHDAQAGRLNWVGTGNALSAIGNPVFTADRGYQGDGSTSCFDTGFVPGSGQTLRDSHHLSLWSRSAGQWGVAEIGAETLSITGRDGMLTAELKGVAAALERPVVEETSPECRAELGDRRCRVAMAGRRRFALVTGIEGTVLTLDGEEPVANCYGGGRLRWFGGRNSGLEDAIARSDGATVTLRRPPRFDAIGRVELIEGCDKSLATCGSRFGNVLNFRGEPYLPGTDLLTRYPGG